MTTTLFAPSADCCSRGAQPSIWASFRRLMTAVARWEKNRSDVRRLRQLSDHHLKDIGINRSEICSVVYGQPCEERRRHA